MAFPSLSSHFRLRDPGKTGAGRGRFGCCSSFRNCTSSLFLLAPLLTAMVVTAGSGMTIGAGGGTALVIALAFGLARCLVAVTGCSDGGAGVGAGAAGAALAVTMGSLGAATSIPFDVEALSAVTAAEAVAINAFLLMFFKKPEAAEVVLPIFRPISVLASPPDRACALAAPSAFERSTIAACSMAVGGTG